MSRNRHARRRARDRAHEDRGRNGHDSAPAGTFTPAGTFASAGTVAHAVAFAPAGTIAVRLATGAEGVVLHQRLEARPPASRPEGFGGRRYLLKEVFE